MFNYFPEKCNFLIVSTIVFLLYIAGSSQHKSSGAFLCQKFASETKILKHGFAYRFPQLDDHEIEKFATFDLEPLEVFLSYFENFKWTKRRLQLCNILTILLITACFVEKKNKLHWIFIWIKNNAQKIFRGNFFFRNSYTCSANIF